MRLLVGNQRGAHRIIASWASPVAVKSNEMRIERPLESKLGLALSAHKMPLAQSAAREAARGDAFAFTVCVLACKQRRWEIPGAKFVLAIVAPAIRDQRVVRRPLPRSVDASAAQYSLQSFALPKKRWPANLFC